MSICMICSTILKNTNGLAKHIHNQHNMCKEEYYNTYIKEESPICVCGNRKRFRHLGEGYRKYCSAKCRSNHIEPTKYWQGKKQPQTMIDARRNTIEEKYGVSNGYLVKHSKAEKYKGFVCRSKYEKMFVDFAEKFGYTLEVPPRIEYTYLGRSRHYYPDFYVVELDLIVEIKSDWTWNRNIDMNIAKITSALEQQHNIVAIDEEHGINDESKWEELNEYLCVGY